MSYRDLDFRPDPSGLRALYVYEDGTHELPPVIGWLVQEEWDDDTYAENGEPGDRDRRIVAAVMSGDDPACPEAVDEWDDFDDWHAFVRILAVGEPDPDAEAIAHIHAQRIQHRDDRIASRRKAAERDAPKVLAALMLHAVPLGSSLAGLNTRRTSMALDLLAEQGQAVYDREANRWRVLQREATA